jgi:hypothetical protein
MFLEVPNVGAEESKGLPGQEVRKYILLQPACAFETVNISWF